MLLFSHLETFTMCFFIKKGQNFSYSQCRSKSSNPGGGGMSPKFKIKK